MENSVNQLGNPEVEYTLAEYSVKGRECPVYPVVKEVERTKQFEVRTSDYLANLSKGAGYDGLAEAYQHLGSYFAMSDLTLEMSADLEYIPPGGVTLPGTLRRTSRYSGWTPEKYYEGDD